MSAEQVRGKAGMDAGGSECRCGGGNRQEVCDHSHSIPVRDVNETLAITAKIFFSINYFYYDVDKDPSTTLRDPVWLMLRDLWRKQGFQGLCCRIAEPVRRIAEPVLQDC